MNMYSLNDTAGRTSRLSILWPVDLKPVDGYCYGWDGPLICVAGILQADSLEEAIALLSEISHSDRWSGLRGDIAIDFPSVLGRFSMPQDTIAGTTLSVTSFSGPRLELCSQDTMFEVTASEIIRYKRPNQSAMQFYSSEYRELDIVPSQVTKNTASRRPPPASLILSHDFSRPSFASLSRLDDTVIRFANASQTLADFLETALSRRQGKQTSRPPSVGPVPERSASTQPFQQVIAAGRVVRYMMSFLRDFSTTIEQLDVRSEQVTFLITQAPFITGRCQAQSADRISRYVKFYNCIWLMLNDMIIGVAFGSFLCENCLVLGNLLDSFTQIYLVESMQRALIWLNSWPAGLKLNTELSQFYCHSLLAAITIWGRVLRNVGPYYPALLWMVGAAGCCGMTMIVSLLSDIISLLTVHVYVCYVLSATVFRQVLGLAGSLWNLFRGKRFNVLRNRLDSWDYDIDQLLLGTILFTLVAFLSPTVLTYYALFATTHLAGIMLHGLLDTISALLNHFPLFALMLRIKDPMRLPGHIVFRRLPSGSLVLENQPASLSSVFAHYGQLWSRLSSHYHPLRLLGLLMSGRILTLIPRSAIRFSMIPSQSAQSVSSARTEKT